jgi:N-acetylmuramoyl-L-alanine amidase
VRRALASLLAAAVSLALGLAGCSDTPAAASHAAAVAVAAPAQPQTPTPSGPLGGRIIVLDPGHGDHTGAESAAGNWEDDNVLAIARDTAALLRRDGAQVHLTRTGPHLLGSVTNTDLTRRVADAIRWKADVFISIHQNASGDGDTAENGTQTFYATSVSRRLARDVQSAVVGATHLVDLGIHVRQYWVVACNPMPAVLVEGGYLTNPNEAAEISQSGFFRREARGLEAALLTYFHDSTDPVGAHPLPAKLSYMCSLGPVAGGAWAEENLGSP